MANWPSGSTPSWPTQLPWTVQLRGYQESLPKTIIRTQMEVGPDKLRRRVTANVRLIRCIVALRMDQVALLDTFFEVTTKGGALQFAWYKSLKWPTHIGTEGWWRFISPPTYQARGGGFWDAQLELEAMP